MTLQMDISIADLIARIVRQISSHPVAVDRLLARIEIADELVTDTVELPS